MHKHGAKIWKFGLMDKSIAINVKVFVSSIDEQNNNGRTKKIVAKSY